jgi:arabinogalactan oligomer / maltooligosaccharide transport system permease protein
VAAPPQPVEPVSTAAAPTPSAAPETVRWSLPARLVTAFSGTPAFVLKIALLALVNAGAIWAGAHLANADKWFALGLLVLATLALDAVFLGPGRSLPLKFLVPGMAFLLAFQVVPIAYTAQIAFTNYSTGHILSKEEAIATIQETSLAAPADGKTYTLSPAFDRDDELVLLLHDDASGETFVGTSEGLVPLPDATVEVGRITAAPGYRLVTGAQLFQLDRQLSTYRVPVEGGMVRPEGVDGAVELRPTLRYDAAADTFTRISNGRLYSDNGKGSYVAAGGEDLEPGWKTTVGFRNFSRVVNDKLIRDPFLRVFTWTVAFATLTVLLSFALGLLLAITLDKKFRFQRFYRTVFVIPYAIPSFLTLLVWAGLLNDDFGVVNRILGTSIPWLFDPWWAKVSIILVSLWLTFPYFFLVSLGALQSIPGELVEAARVDGAGPWQVFRKITLPLLLVAVAPLLIASFAFNFNNFNNIFLLTQGQPPTEDQSIAGATDILISYTYKLAFSAGKGTDYALASTVSIFIFLIVALISTVAFWRSKSLEALN